MVRRRMVVLLLASTGFAQFLAEAKVSAILLPFPKNNSGRDVMLDAPSTIDEKQLDELNLKLDMKKRLAFTNKLIFTTIPSATGLEFFI